MTFGKMLNTFSFWLSSNLSKQKSPTEYMPIISDVVLFCLDKFEDNQNEKVFNIFSNVIVNLTLDIKGHTKNPRLTWFIRRAI